MPPNVFNGLERSKRALVDPAFMVQYRKRSQLMISECFRNIFKTDKGNSL